MIIYNLGFLSITIKPQKTAIVAEQETQSITILGSKL